MRKGENRFTRARLILGWITVLVSTGVAGFWTWWGIIENFHEGWYATSLLELLGQYLGIAILLTVLSLVALAYPRIGFSCYLGAALFAAWFLGGSNFLVLVPWILAPLACLGLLFLFGRVRRRRIARLMIVVVPLLIVMTFGTPLYLRHAARVDDGDHGARLVEGNGVRLVWAPAGPGWPDGGVSWDEAGDICRRLSADGTRVLEEPVGVWRLPTVDEAVRSMALHGENCGGVWDAKAHRASYEKTPDKETPLWRLHSDVIYLWTGTEASGDPERAHIVVYDGGVWTRKKKSRYGYLSFRAVRDP
jgi:hypothetical protein